MESNHQAYFKSYQNSNQEPLMFGLENECLPFLHNSLNTTDNNYPPHPDLIQPASCVLELRKERSRDAARSRRGKENHEFNQLARMLPLPYAITMQLDKASIIRLTTAYLKIKFFSTFGIPCWTKNTFVTKISQGRISESSTPSSSSKRQKISNDKSLMKQTSSSCLQSPDTQKNSNLPIPPHYIENFDQNHGNNILQGLDGFAFALYNDGRILYISETVSIYLGLSQVEMTGSSIFDYVHIRDQSEMAKKMGLDLRWICSTTPRNSNFKTGATDNDYHLSPGLDPYPMPETKSNRIKGETKMNQDDNFCSSFPEIAFSETIGTMKTKDRFNRVFCVRMKSTLSKRGNHVRQSGYRVLQLHVRFRTKNDQMDSNKGSKTSQLADEKLIGLVGIAIAPPPPAIHEIKIDNDMFVMRLNLDLQISSCEFKVNQYTGLDVEDLTKKSLYDFCHIYDLPKLRRHHIDLIKKGQIITDYYRFICKSGGYIWLQTCATVVFNNSKNMVEEDENIIFINYIISHIENPTYCLTAFQCNTDKKEHTHHSESNDAYHSQQIKAKPPCDLFHKKASKDDYESLQATSLEQINDKLDEQKIFNFNNRGFNDNCNEPNLIEDPNPPPILTFSPQQNSKPKQTDKRSSKNKIPPVLDNSKLKPIEFNKSVKQPKDGDKVCSYLSMPLDRPWDNVNPLLITSNNNHALNINSDLASTKLNKTMLQTIPLPNLNFYGGEDLHKPYIHSDPNVLLYEINKHYINEIVPERINKNINTMSTSQEDNERSKDRFANDVRFQDNNNLFNLLDSNYINTLHNTSLKASNGKTNDCFKNYHLITNTTPVPSLETYSDLDTILMDHLNKDLLLPHND